MNQKWPLLKVLVFISGSVDSYIVSAWYNAGKMTIFFCLNSAPLFSSSVAVKSRSHLVFLLLKALLNRVPSVISAERTAESDAAAVMESPLESR